MGVVMVVDSRGDVARSVSDALAGKSGFYAVVEHRTGGAAISAVREGAAADIAVIDDRLEDMEGVDFLASLKRIAPELPVVMSSGHPSVEGYLKALHAGVFEFVSRPVSSSVLWRILTAALEERVVRPQHADRTGKGPG